MKTLVPDDLFLDSKSVPDDLFSDNKPTNTFSNITNKAADALSSAINKNPLLPIQAGPTVSALDMFLNRSYALPLVGQLAGSPGGFAGSVVGSGIGEAARQASEFVRGNRDLFDYKKVGKEVAVTAAIEAATRIPAAGMFRSLRAGDELRNGAGLTLSKIKSDISKVSQTTVKIDDILTPIKEGLDNIAVKSGQQASQLNKWKIALEAMKKDGKEFFDGKTLIQIEDQLGEISKFRGSLFQPQIKNRAANALSKDINRKASALLDDFAVNNGYKDFPVLSKKVSKLISKIKPNKEGLIESLQQAGSRLTWGGALGAGVGMATHNAGIGFGMTAASGLLSEPGIQKALYYGVEKSGLGRAATLAASQAARD